MNEWQNAERDAERALAYYDSCQWERALAALKRAVAVNPDQSEWHYGMALTLDALHRYTEAIACFRRVIKLRGEDPDIMLHLAIDLIECERYRSALKVLKRINEVDADFEQAYCYQILVHGRLGDHDLAEQCFYMAKQLVDECPRCYDHIAQSLAATGQYDRAIWCWQQVMRLDKQYPDVAANLGRAYWAKGNHQRAQRLYARQLKLNPGDSEALLDLGTLLMEIGRYAEAGDNLRRALERDPKLAEAHLHLGELSLLNGHVDAAQKQLYKAQHIDADLPGLHLRMAEVARRRGLIEGARAHLRQELHRVGTHPDQRLELAAMLVQLEMVQPAIDLVTELIDTAEGPTTLRVEQMGTALLCRGVAHLNAGQVDAGVLDCRESVRLTPKNTVAMHNLVVAHLNRRRVAHACYWLNRLRKISPADPSLRSLQRRLFRVTITSTLRRVLTRLHPSSWFSR